MEIAGYVQATWGRLTLWVAKLEGDGSRSLVVHDPSRGDDHAVDDRGSRAERTRLSLLFDDMTGEAEAPIVRFNRLRSQVKALSSMSTPPIFQHPLGEVFPARVGEFTYAIDEHSNVSDVVIEFYPDGDVQAVSPAGAGVAGISGEGAVSQAADDLDAAVSAAGLDAVTVTADARAAQSSWTAGETVPTRQVLVDTADLTEQLATMIDELGLEDDLELWDVYLATIMLADAVRSAAIAATSEVPSVFVFQVAQPVALFALMALLYGGAEAEDRARQAEELNDIRTPGWLEPGPLLLPTRRASAEF